MQKQQQRITHFHGEHVFLSNFYPALMAWDDETYIV